MNDQKIIILSMDALVREDLDYMKTKPVFGAFLERAAQVEHVKSIYPTLTYPCHATMATGCWPSKHGVLSNLEFDPGNPDPAWNWYHDVYRVPDVLDRAKEAGKTTAVVGWPTMARHPHVDYLVAEIAGTKAKTDAEFREQYLLTGTPETLWKEVCESEIHCRSVQKEVHLFNAHTAANIIRKYAPDLLLFHGRHPDATRHKYGVFAPEVRYALDQCEETLKLILDAVKESGAEERTNVVVTADHGQMDVKRNARVNVLFANFGFAEVDEAGKLLSWKAWSHSTGMSTRVFVKDPADEASVLELLQSFLGMGYSRIYTRKETAEMGYDGPFSFMLETDGVTSFSDKWTGPYLTPPAKLGSHGYHPDKAPRPPIAAAGPAFRAGAVLPDARLIDGAPTWAKVLGFDLPDADGRVLEELLK